MTSMVLITAVTCFLIGVESSDIRDTAITASLSQPGVLPQYLLRAVSSWFLTWRVSADYDVDADDVVHDHEAII